MDRYMPPGIITAQIRYEKWWLNKRCRLLNSRDPFRKVIRVELVGPPSFIYGGVILHFEGGMSTVVYDHGHFKPRKKDVEVQHKEGE